MKTDFLPPVDQGVPLGAIDRHCHLDRAWTLKPEYLSPIQFSPETLQYMSLAAKQNLMGDLHRSPAYDKVELACRMDAVITAKYAAGERVMWAVIDTPADCVRLRALESALELRSKWAKKGYDLNVGAYPIFGFKEHGSDREKIFREAAKEAQFVCLLPERDERPGHTVTFEHHIRIGLEVACENNLPAHIHLDQMNVEHERGTERLFEGLRYLDQPKVVGDNYPVKVVHDISPTCYMEDRFQRHLDGFLEFNLELITCPVAGGSMRQLDVFKSRTHNCIARVWDYVSVHIPVGIGSDNIGDPFVPIWKPTLDREIAELATLTRFYDFNIYHKLLLSEELTQPDIDNVLTFLEMNRQANQTALRATRVG